VAVFNARGVSAQEAGAFFDVTLTEVSGDTKVANSLSNLHDFPGCDGFDCWRWQGWTGDIGTASKNQIADGEYDQGQEDSGGYCDQHPTAKFWARSGKSQEVRGEVWRKVRIGWQWMICGTWHEERLASGGDSWVGMYRIGTQRGKWRGAVPILVLGVDG
jgi:hypothetical protein